MNKFVLCGAVALLTLSTAARAGDPLAPARAGKLECYLPDMAKKTCYAIASYTFNADGTIDNAADELLSPNELLELKITSRVVLKNDAVCGMLRKEDIEAATLVYKGQVLPKDKADPIIAALEQALGPLIGKEVCSTMTPDGDGFVSQATIDGVAHPELTQRGQWIGANDGYTLGPPPSMPKLKTQ